MLATTSKTELNARCNRCITMHTCPTLNNRNVLLTPAHSAKFMTKCSISKELPMLLLRFWKRNSSRFLINSSWIANNTKPWKDNSSLACKSTCCRFQLVLLRHSLEESHLLGYLRHTKKGRPILLKCCSAKNDTVILILLQSRVKLTNYKVFRVLR